MAKIKQSPKLPAAERREQLLASAHKLFAEKGYRATSTEEIARYAGLTKGAFYFHFQSKEEILFALIKYLVSQFEKSLAQIPVPLTPGKVIYGIMECASARAKDFRTVMDLWVQAIRIPRIRRHINETHRRQVDYFCRHLDPAYGLSREEAEQLAVMVFSLCDGLAARRVLDSKSVDVETQVRLVDRLLESMQTAKVADKKLVKGLV